MNHITIRLTGSPSKGLDVELLGREAGGGSGTTDAGNPRFRSADVDVAFDKIRDPVPQSGQLVDPVQTGAQPGVGGPASTRQVDQLQPALAGEHVELPRKERLLAEPVEQHRV